jgi:hypothetical protein
MNLPVEDNYFAFFFLFPERGKGENCGAPEPLASRGA